MALYAAAKFVAYCVWCWLGLLAFAPAHASLARSLKYGALRWLLGLAFGIVAAIALGSVSRESVATLYFSVYAPLRVWLWILGGVSFLSDLTSPEGMAGRFCVGRCLC